MTESSVELVFVGCYTAGAGGDGDGIGLARRDPGSGELTWLGVAAKAIAPSYVVCHPELPVLYAVSEVEDGAVTAYAVSPEGALSPLGAWPTGGSFPCHLTVVTPSRGTAWLAVANYGTGSVAGLCLDEHGIPNGRHDLAIHSGQTKGGDPQRQDGPHAHMVVGADEGVLAVDLGIDRILYHPFDPDSGTFGPTIELAELPAGTGPRHLVTDKAGRIHVVGELDGTVTVFDTGPNPWRAADRTRTTQTVHTQPSHIHISVDGRFLYVGNRGADTIAVLSLADDTPGIVAEVPCGGAWPRHFAIIDGYLYVANERSNEIAVLALDPETGVPHPTGTAMATPSPTCVSPQQAPLEVRR
jgi:6-phosphogluconolactonase (cycloisomerase 2 family)